MPQESQWEGKPTIVLNPESKYKFSFGVAKAKLIIENIDAIKAFVTKHSRPVKQGRCEDAPCCGCCD